MVYFLKINVVSSLYAFALFITLELMLNVHRISRITGWDLDAVIIAITAVDIIGFILCTILFILLIKNWMEGRSAVFWTLLLWVPYFVLFIYLVANLVPMNDPGEMPSPGSGLMAIGTLILFPIYLAIINFVGIGLYKDKK